MKNRRQNSEDRIQRPEFGIAIGIGIEKLGTDVDFDTDSDSELNKPNEPNKLNELKKTLDPMSLNLIDTKD